MEKITVLLVEDEQTLAMIIKDTLEGQNFIIHTAADGEEGLRKFFDLRPDVLVADVMMPRMDGIQLSRALKADRALVDIPLIILTAKQDTSTIVEGLTLGADDYLTKPYQLEELWARILVQLRHASAAPSGELLRYRDWVLNLEEMTLTAAGQPVNLTAHEFKIVELLAGRPKRVFTKQHIYEAVWQEAYAVEDKTITVHISNIRAKLRPSGTDGYIQTVWGIGFKLAE